MRERLAEAIWASHVDWKKGESKKTWGEIGEGTREEYRYLASAVCRHLNIEE